MTRPDKKAVWGWAMYDWANSAFATTVMAGFFPVFFKQYWSAGVDANLSTARLGIGNAIVDVLARADLDETRIKEKLLAAQRIEMGTVIIPRENEKDLAEIPEDIASQLEFRLQAANPRPGSHCWASQQWHPTQ